MVCCDRCAAVYRWSYELSGDGDGIEYLVEIGHLTAGGRTRAEVVLTAPGPYGFG